MCASSKATTRLKERQDQRSGDGDALRQIIEQSQRANDALVAQLNKQREDAAAETLRLQQQLAAEEAAKTAARAAEQQTTYATTITDAPVSGAQTTAVAERRRKNSGSLRISSASRSAPGAGINLGV